MAAWGRPGQSVQHTMRLVRSLPVFRYQSLGTLGDISANVMCFCTPAPPAHVNVAMLIASCFVKRKSIKLPPLYPRLDTLACVDTSPENFALAKPGRQNILLYSDALLPPPRASTQQSRHAPAFCTGFVSTMLFIYQ
jgi:hypothetical protein